MTLSSFYTRMGILILLTSSTNAQAPLGTAFTYQGTLKLSGGIVADGLHDMRFRLFDAGAGGAQVGPTVCLDGVNVSAGLFTVQLDFGSAPFGGDGRWLEIDVRADATPANCGVGAYTPLSPRQPLTAVPYALYALNAPGSTSYWTNTGTALTNTDGGNFVGIHRSDRVTTSEYFGVQAPLQTGFGGMYIRTSGAAGLPFYGYAAGSMTAWHYLEGGTGKWHLNNGGVRLTVDRTNGNVGIGTTSPAARLDVIGASGSNPAVRGLGYWGVYGVANATDGYGGFFAGAGAFGSGQALLVSGDAHFLGSVGIGTTSPSYRLQVDSNSGSTIYGRSTSSSGIGVRGDGDLYGVYGNVPSTASSNSAAVRGFNSSDGHGISGVANGNGAGVLGSGCAGFGVYGSNGGCSGYAGYFFGRTHVAGVLSKSSGSFRIDHPLDPANKYLYHSFVESPDMMNIYNGNVTTDSDGYAIVRMPEWFDALNRDFRYQLTVIGQFAQAIVAEEMSGSRFVIRTDKPGVRVSWQVTGIRQDPYAEANRIPVEEDKPAGERGRYQHPEVYGLPQELRIDYRPERDGQPEPTELSE